MKKYCGYCGFKIASTAKGAIRYVEIFYNNTSEKFLTTEKHEDLNTIAVDIVKFLKDVDPNTPITAKVYLDNGSVELKFTAGNVPDTLYATHLYPYKEEEYIHFTRKEIAPKIIKDNKLDSDGGMSVFAVSTSFGEYRAGVQTRHTDKNYDNLVAIIFKTNVKPSHGYIEEVSWKQDVPFTSAKIVSHDQAKTYLKSKSKPLGKYSIAKYY
jgi:hypothetical protein